MKTPFSIFFIPDAAAGKGNSILSLFFWHVARIVQGVVSRRGCNLTRDDRKQMAGSLRTTTKYSKLR